MNYRSFLIGIAILGLHSQNAKPMQHVDMNTAKTVAWLGAAALVGGGIPCVTKKLKDCQSLNKMCDNAAINLDDASNVIGVAAGSFVLSNAVANGTAETLQRFSVRAIPAAMVVGLTSNKTSARLFNRIPLIGQFIICPDANLEESVENEQNRPMDNTDLNQVKKCQKCPGICSKCKLTKGILAIAGYAAVSGLINCVNVKFGTNL